MWFNIGILIANLGAQWQVLANFQTCLYPPSFRVTTETRGSMYWIEVLLLDRIREVSEKQIDDYRELNQKVSRIVEQIKMGIEILDDVHGKAIFVFTVVTNIFLP